MHRVLFSLVLVSAVVVACSDDSSSGSSSSGQASSSSSSGSASSSSGGSSSSSGGAASSSSSGATGTSIGAGGGTVTHPSGAKIVVPAGALTADTKIEIEEIAAPAGLDVSFRGKVFWLKPEGQMFAKPVTVTLPYDPTIETSTSPVLEMITAPHDTADFSTLGSPAIDTAAHTVTATTTHFSIDGAVCKLANMKCAAQATGAGRKLEALACCSGLSCVSGKCAVAACKKENEACAVKADCCDGDILLDCVASGEIKQCKRPAP